MNPGKIAMLTFKTYANSHGYNNKIVGDHAFSKTKNPQSAIIKLISAKNNKLLIYESKIGRYEIEYGNQNESL